MAFNLKKYLTENKLTDISKRLDEVHPKVKEAEKRYKDWKNLGGEVRIDGKITKMVPRGVYNVVESDGGGMYDYPKFTIRVTEKMDPYNLALQMAEAFGYISSWNYIALEKSNNSPKNPSFPLKQTSLNL